MEIRIENVCNVFASDCFSICPAVIWSTQHKLTVLEPYQFHTLLRYLLGVVRNNLKNYKECLVSTLRKVFSTRFASRLQRRKAPTHILGNGRILLRAADRMWHAWSELYNSTAGLSQSFSTRTNCGPLKRLNSLTSNVPVIQINMYLC
jgi:hypothetical protein